MANRIITFNGYRVSETKLAKVWLIHFTSEPFPRVQCYDLKADEFERVYRMIMESGMVTNRSEWEYGKRVKIEEASAFTVSSETGYLIFRRERSPHTIEEDLEHELRHIFNGDIERGVQDF